MRTNFGYNMLYDILLGVQSKEKYLKRKNYNVKEK